IASTRRAETTRLNDQAALSATAVRLNLCLITSLSFDTVCLRRCNSAGVAGHPRLSFVSATPAQDGESTCSMRQQPSHLRPSDSPPPAARHSPCSTLQGWIEYAAKREFGIHGLYRR